MRAVCRPALAGNELYLNGLYSGTTSIHRAFSTTGPSRLIAPARRGGRRDADHRRDQHQLRCLRQRRVAQRIERVLRHQRAAVRVAHEDERLAGAGNAADVPDPHPDGGSPVFPTRVDQPAGNRAVALHPQRHGVVAGRVEPFGHGPHAVRRIGQAMNQQRATRGLGHGEDLRAVPVGASGSRDSCGCPPRNGSAPPDWRRRRPLGPPAPGPRETVPLRVPGTPRA